MLIHRKIFLVVAQRLKTAWAHYLYLKETASSTGKFQPSTAPCYPTPGKKFMIIRTEINAPQPGIFMGFDSFTKALNAEGLLANDSSDTDNTAKPDAKRRWSIIGKVLSLTGSSASAASATSGAGSTTTTPGNKASWEEEFEQARRDLATSRSKTSTQQAGPPPPPKVSTTTSPAGGTSPPSDASSTGSSPVYDVQQYIFKFTLSWHQSGTAPQRDRILTKPRLPAPAQARVSARSRSGSHPPPPAAGLPPPTRRVSGLAQTGLVNEARNASPLQSATDSPPLSPTLSSSRLSLSSFGQPQSFQSESPSTDVKSAESSGSDRLSDDEDKGREGKEEQTFTEPITTPVKPTGLYASNAVYTGRSLAEWAVVVNECNSFVDRRRDEGVLGLSDVEVPILGVEGFRKLA
jgi:hypothetical protein